MAFYKADSFLGSYLVFEGPNKIVQEKSVIKIPNSSLKFDKIVIKEDHWRLAARMSNFPRIDERSFALMWQSKSTFLPATRKEIRNSTDPKRLFLTQIPNLPNLSLIHI